MSNTLEKNWAEQSLKKHLPPETLRESIDKIRANSKVIVTVNGSFDLLHAGHLQIIYEAKCQGDILVVALNTDSSIKGYKGPSRPIVPLKYRLEMMAALEFVDYVTWFDEATPCTVLEKIRPDVHVNGHNYGHNCVEAKIVGQCGARLHLVSLVDGLSTSTLIEKIQHA